MLIFNRFQNNLKNGVKLANSWVVYNQNMVLPVPAIYLSSHLELQMWPPGGTQKNLGTDVRLEISTATRYIANHRRTKFATHIKHVKTKFSVLPSDQWNFIQIPPIFATKPTGENEKGTGGGALEWQEGYQARPWKHKKHPNHIFFRYENKVDPNYAFLHAFFLICPSCPFQNLSIWPKTHPFFQFCTFLHP